MSINTFPKSGYSYKAVLLISIFAAVSPLTLMAQMELEEVIVTAQRREQSLQDVPISIEAYSGDTILKQGFRTMEDLVYFSPSVQMDVQPRDQDVTVRGAGSVGNNLALQQSVPAFNVVTRSAFPTTESYAGRVTMQWTPNDDFDATLQANYGYQENGGQSVALAAADGTPDMRNADGQFYFSSIDIVWHKDYFEFDKSSLLSNKSGIWPLPEWAVRCSHTLII